MEFNRFEYRVFYLLNSYGPPHMAVQKQDDQHEDTFSNYVRIRDVVLKTCLGRWTIRRSGERGSGISVLPPQHDDDDDDDDDKTVVFWNKQGSLPTLEGVSHQPRQTHDRQKQRQFVNLRLNYISLKIYFSLIYFLCLMAYQSSWVI